MWPRLRRFSANMGKGRQERAVFRGDSAQGNELVQLAGKAGIATATHSAPATCQSAAEELQSRLQEGTAEMDGLRAASAEFGGARGQEPQGCGPAFVQRSQTAPELQRQLCYPLLGHSTYRFIQELNRGSSGFVQKALDLRTGQEVAIKFIHCWPGAPSCDPRHLTRELLNHRLAGRHPNIVQLLEVFTTPHHLAIVLEYANGGDLAELIDQRGDAEVGGIPEGDAAWFFQQLVCAVDFCHRLDIANRNIKLDNMLLHGLGARPMLRICDFGYSKDEMGHSISKSTCGTPEYMAPEVLFEDEYDGKKADVWSCGVSLFVLLTGEFPFARASDKGASNVVRMQRMFARIIKGDMQPVPHLSPECQDLLSRMLRPQPDERASLAEVAAHPWLAAATPCLPPLRVNDQLAACMDRFGRADRGTCRQSASEIVDLIAACAEEHRGLGRKGRRRRPSPEPHTWPPDQHTFTLPPPMPTAQPPLWATGSAEFAAQFARAASGEIPSRFVSMTL